MHLFVLRISFFAIEKAELFQEDTDAIIDSFQLPDHFRAD